MMSKYVHTTEMQALLTIQEITRKVNYCSACRSHVPGSMMETQVQVQRETSLSWFCLQLIPRCRPVHHERRGSIGRVCKTDGDSSTPEFDI